MMLPFCDVDAPPAPLHTHRRRSTGCLLCLTALHDDEGEAETLLQRVSEDTLPPLPGPHTHCPPLISHVALHDDEGEVETLLQRVSEGLMPEFRREAVGQLRDLLAEGNPRTQVALGNASGLTVRGGKAQKKGRKNRFSAGHRHAWCTHRHTWATSMPKDGSRQGIKAHCA